MLNHAILATGTAPVAIGFMVSTLPSRPAGCQSKTRLAVKSGGGPPQSKTLARGSVAGGNAQRLGVLQSSGALAGNHRRVVGWFLCRFESKTRFSARFPLKLPLFIQIMTSWVGVMTSRVEVKTSWVAAPGRHRRLI